MLPRQVTVHHPFTHLAQAKVSHLHVGQTVANKEMSHIDKDTSLLPTFFLPEFFININYFRFVVILLVLFIGRVKQNCG